VIKKSSIHKNGIVRIGVFITGILFIFAGILRNEVGIVLKKAVSICLECIGIG
jgi:hypothetical protein